MKNVLIVITFLILNCNTERILNLGLGSILGAISGIARVGWGLTLPWSATTSRECGFISEIAQAGASHFIMQGLLPKENRSPLGTWNLNQKFLSQVPIVSREANQLVQFLENRWLAKSSGFHPTEVHWICPSFGIPIQINPATTNCYARDPFTRMTAAYRRRVEAWKQILPQPLNFPLILTRPYDLRKYLPQNIVDLTDCFEGITDPNEWLAQWEKVRPEKKGVICIQRLKQEDLGGLRILSSSEEEDLHADLLEWISCFGLAASAIEVERWPAEETKRTLDAPFIPGMDLVEFSSYLEMKQIPKSFMVEGTVKLLKGLLKSDRWESVFQCPTRSSIARFSLLKIREELDQIKEEASFCITASHLEQIHAHISSLLEIASPYSADAFPTIYRGLLKAIPSSLIELTSCDLHASGMTSVAGIFQAFDNKPRVLYGENAYFECVQAAELASLAHTSTLNAVEEDYREADLLLAQFNPVWKRDALQNSEYRAENVAEMLQKALFQREKPLTLALDCTLDLIDSPRVGKLLQEFEGAILSGKLNVVCYRSGLKFDLFGMDNYCGAPIYMIHNRDPKWAHFDAMLKDPALRSDLLSQNWFCLAYSHASDELELYRKQIFKNTRDLLNKLPKSLLGQGRYRVIPFEEDATPTFIDIHIYGPFHKLRSSAIVAGYLYLRSLKSGHPIFYRRSLGFYHLNFGLLFGKESSTIRLTLGLDPKEVDLLADCFAKIDNLN